MTRSLVEKYRLGMISDHQLVVDSLNSVDPENPDLALNNLPKHIFDQVVQFADTYESGRMLATHGAIPTQDQVDAASNWIKKTQQRMVKTA